MVVFASLVAAYNEGDTCLAPDPMYYGYYAPHPEYCHRYLQCIHGVFVGRNCSPGLHWNPEAGFNGACDFPANYNCQGQTTIRTTTEGTTITHSYTEPTTTTPVYESTTYETTYNTEP